MVKDKYLFYVSACSGTYSSIASDGLHIYVHNNLGLHKIGTGFGSTIKVRMRYTSL